MSGDDGGEDEADDLVRESSCNKKEGLIILVIETFPISYLSIALCGRFISSTSKLCPLPD